MIRKLVVEAVGTFFLVFTVGMVVLNPGATPFAPFAIGGVLMAMVFAGGHISGGHYNPSVTLSVWLRGACTIHEAIGYWVFQLVAGALAAVIVLWFKGGAPLTQMTIDVPRVLAAEFIFTFALSFVVLNVAAARGVEGNSYFGLAIGLVVAVGTMACGVISGGAFNPSIATAFLVFGVIAPGDLWPYYVAQLVAGAAAAGLFNVLDLGDDKPTTASAAAQETLAPQSEPGP